MAYRNPEDIVQEIWAILETSRNSDYYGEKVSQLEHALQCAKLAADAGSDEDTILAALLHDIGHLCPDANAEHMGEAGVADHEGIGASFLRERGFSEKVARLVGGHVDAKRYLTLKHPAYFAQLSEASLETLRHQGGPMSAEEATAFERDPLHKAILRLRSWDEQAKKVAWEVPSLDAYETIMTRHLNG